MTNTTTTKFHKVVLCSLIIEIIGKCKGDFFNHSQIYWQCTAGQNYTEGSPLDTNIQTVLHNISAAGGYKTAVYGDNPDKVYALSECRGDKTPSQCRKCLKGAAKTVKELCGKSPGAQIWYDDWGGCYLHFEHDTNFIGVLATVEGQFYWDGDNVSGNDTSFRNTVVNLMHNLTYEATNINNNSVKRYASGTALDSSSSRKIFGLVQCWRDISVDDCKSCLARSMDMISSYLESLGGINLCGSCIARYEPFSFFSASPPPPAPPRTIIHDFPPSHDSEKRKILDWSKRINIIHGIIKGLLYMHEESMLRIIHRDIKAGNILLDDKYNAKIADFGLAKLFHGDRSCIHTTVAGTRGYMAPEYVMHGQLSIKADVYSFGILLLEIISGRKNNEFSHNDLQGFLAWAWKSYREGNTREMLDETLKQNYNYEEAARCAQVGLLCTQADPYRRPLMSQINMMLSKNLVTLANPMKPAFLSMSMTSSSACDSKKCENEKLSPAFLSMSMTSSSVCDSQKCENEKLSRACERSNCRSPISADCNVTILEPR